MGVARSLERRLEGMMEGFFTKLFRSGLQPVEIGRRVLREMDENRTISVNRVYAPNEFLVFMSPDDYERFSKMEDALRREFSDLVIQSAKSNHWNLMGAPRISFHQNDDMRAGELAVDASLAAEPEVRAARVSTHEPKGDNFSATRVVSSTTAERLGLSGSQAELIVLDEEGKPSERISVTRTPASIGRLSNNDVVLADPNVSRRHAELRCRGSHWTIVDLGSTNGTLVNGKVAKEHTLRDGDRLAFGTTELIFKMVGGA
jgi:hypothetical protein